jgi:phage recombination protein Bet
MREVMPREATHKETQKQMKTKQVIQMIKLLYPHLEKAMVPDVEILKALSLAKHLGLDPLKREVHFVPYKRRVQLIVSYLEYIKRAERSGKLDGWTVRFEGKSKKNLKATVTIYRKDWAHPFEWTVYYEEVKKDTPTWQDMPLFMLRKVAICQAFRMAFPEETGSLPYEEAEIIDEVKVEDLKEDIPLEETSQYALEEKEDEMIDTTTGEIIEKKPREKEFATREQLNAIFALLNKKGISTKKEDRVTFVSEIIGRKINSFTELTKEEAGKIIETLQKQGNLFDKVKENTVAEGFIPSQK